jgi:hypothetical protein
MPGFDLTAREGDVPLGARRVAEEERQRVSSEEYLATHDLELYLREALKHAARCAAVKDPRGANPNTHIEAAAEYFQAVNLGRHVAGREWPFVSATTRNTMAFLHDCDEAWGNADARLSAKDWHSALRLQCPDVPFAVVRAALDAAVGIDACDERQRGRGDGGEDGGFDELRPGLRAATIYAACLDEIRGAAFEHSDLTPRDVEGCRASVRAAAVNVGKRKGKERVIPEDALVDAFVDSSYSVDGDGKRVITFRRFQAALCAHEGLARVTGAMVRDHAVRVKRASAAERAREYRDS